MGKKIDVVIATTSDELRTVFNEYCVETPKAIPESSLPASPKLLYSLRDLASFLGCSVGTAQKLKNSGKIRYSQFGRKCVFNSQHILDDIKRIKAKP